jgi:hypothetical protein
MNQKEFNLLLSDLSNTIKPINQLLYECLILIIFYYLFNTISFIDKNTNTNTNTNTNEKFINHISFVYLICFICIILDWFMWNNYIQTTLFTSILIVYIIYNINKTKTISTFINTINDSRDINKMNKQIENYINNNKLEEEYQKEIQQDKLNRITFIPKDIDFSNPKNNPNYSPDAYEKHLNGINDLERAYNGIPSIHITDSKFAEMELSNLHNSPQYKNIKNVCTDKSLDNYNKNQESRNSQYYPLEVSDGVILPTILSINTNNEEDSTNLDLFRNPKKEFLDNKWLTLKENTYNDNCKNCKENNINSNLNSINNANHKNAICSVVKFGQELEECTNQDNYVTNKQLNKISNNKIEAIYKF